MQDAKIVTLYKNKGDRSDCNSYRDISLLSIVGKVFAEVPLARIQVPQEKCRKQNKPLYLAFIYLTKEQERTVSRPEEGQLPSKTACHR